MKTLLCLGLGYTARLLASSLPEGDWRIIGTRRSPVEDDVLRTPMRRAIRFDGSRIGSDLDEALRQTTHLVISIPPNDRGDVLLQLTERPLARAEHLAWIGVLSTTGVYGDHGGRWVDEMAACRPTSSRSKNRLLAEEQWLDLYTRAGLPVHIFRLAGIYGPGRSVIDEIASGKVPTRVHKEGQFFNRIHVGDICQTLLASIQRPHPGRVYNVADDEPSPQNEVIAYACRLLGREPGPLVAFEKAGGELSPMALSFWNDSRRVSNRRIREELEVDLLYPSYREGLRAIAERRESS